MLTSRSTPSGVLSAVLDGIHRRLQLSDFLRRLAAAKQPLSDLIAEAVGSPAEALAISVKILNLCLARYHFVSRSPQVLSRPLGLVVDPINNCNLACPGCVHSARSVTEKLFQWNSGMLSEARFEALLARCGPWALEIMLCNYGEPLMNPLTPRFVHLAKSYLMRTGLSTNMTVRRFDAHAYVDSGLDFMTVSLDGATQEVYAKYRRKGDLEAAFANIRALISARAAAGRPTPIVSWQFLAFEHNAHEIDLAMRIARALGIDQFVVATPFDVSWDDPNIHPAAGVEPRVIQFAGKSDERLVANWMPHPGDFRAAELDRALNEPLRATWPEERSTAAHACHWLYKNMVMDANGRIIPCCAAPKAEADLVFDSFTETEPADPFNSVKYRLARAAFSNPATYSHKKSQAAIDGDPHCVNCEWNQEIAHTDSAQVAQYLRTIPGAPFDAESIQLLADW